MRSPFIRLALALLLAPGTAGRAQPAGDAPAYCQAHPQAEVTLSDQRNFMLAPARLDGHAATLVVDTGAEVSTVTPEAARRFRLPGDSLHGRLLRGVAGAVQSRTVKVGQLTLGGSVVRRDQSIAVGRIAPFPGVDPPVAGLLGTDVLARFDVALDLPGRRMTLYAPGSCKGVAPWPGAVVVPFRPTRSGLVFVDAMIDGQRVRALVDTGARTTLVTRKTARALGVTGAALAQDARRSGSGVGAGSIAIRRHSFAALGVPGAMVHAMPVDIADIRLPGVAMLLGADYLGPRRPWLSYSTGQLFLHDPPPPGPR